MLLFQKSHRKTHDRHTSALSTLLRTHHCCHDLAYQRGMTCNSLRHTKTCLGYIASRWSHLSIARSLSRMQCKWRCFPENNPCRIDHKRRRPILDHIGRTHRRPRRRHIDRCHRSPDRRYTMNHKNWCHRNRTTLLKNYRWCYRSNVHQIQNQDHRRP